PPGPRGAGRGAGAVPDTSRSRGSGLAGMASRPARRAPASPAGGQGDLPLQVRQPAGPARSHGRDVADALGEGPAGARRVGAAEPTSAEPEDDGATLPRQVVEAAFVPAVDPT